MNVDLQMMPVRKLSRREKKARKGKRRRKGRKREEKKKEKKREGKGEEKMRMKVSYGENLIITKILVVFKDDVFVFVTGDTVRISL